MIRFFLTCRRINDNVEELKEVIKMRILFFCLIIFTLSGCAIVGPTSISSGRADYNQVINRTEDEQMLLSVVKSRYGESFSLLAVSGVAANMRFASEAGINIGFGPQAGFAGQLVPFSARMGYEENPTITYAPVQGEIYIRQLMSPIPLDIFVLLVRTTTDPAFFFNVLANRVNDMRNPDFLVGTQKKPNDDFKRFLALTNELNNEGVTKWVRDSRENIPFNILISDYHPAHTEKVREMMELLGLSMPEDKTEEIVIPVSLSVKQRGVDGIAISTRSTYDLIEILMAAVDVPEKHIEAGLVINYPKDGLAGEGIKIHRKRFFKPKHALIATKYRGHWFYIDDRDMQTKMFYLVLRTLWSAMIAEASDQKAAPVLTLPVSR
jgi:hypothetical protein